MAVIITLPTGGSFGPGLQLHAVSSDSHVLTANAIWQFTLASDDSFIHACVVGAGHAQGHSVDIQWLSDITHFSWTVAPQEVILDGAPAYVKAELLDPPTVNDSGTATATFRETAGLGLQALALQFQTPAYTSEDRAKLDQVVAATETSSPIPFGLGELFPFPPLSDMLADVGSFALSGRGTVDPPTFLGRDVASGLWIQSVDVPPGFSLRDGFIQTYRERIAQLVSLNDALLSGHQVPTAEYELRAQSAVWWLPNAEVQHIGYDVTTGCTIHCQWITAVTP